MFRILPPDSSICLVTGISHTLFSKVEIYNQGKLLRAYDNYARLYMIVSLLSKPAGYFKALGTETGDILDTLVPQGVNLFVGNEGAVARQTMSAGSGKINVFNKLWIPCFQTDKLIPTKLQNFQIHMHMHDEKFGKKAIF